MVTGIIVISVLGLGKSSGILGVSVMTESPADTCGGVFIQARKGSFQQSPVMWSPVPAETWRGRDGWKRSEFRATVSFCVEESCPGMGSQKRRRM